ncbi:hypothetical protein TTHERM_000283879 (macronuclear) [Tetrahymena thermophila SB210]|uniref:Transmembrane protein n=1 Tax=Tetrahymena thermophila (strain SB210) TaxID=312017 RepID=W7X3K9_TETTS|nr:hypothetical protein TTHERM_000283879 [Tetrahymena thermophila SB210]EWS73880.1 hypothetical protein TTHERM_000283879 [Tetrahymena thermophila SB210]|eukprot:XP_012653627.1 hypothetical protein TTHERM_000283879 [Tetrahymena thermophila SB210]
MSQKFIFLSIFFLVIISAIRSDNLQNQYVSCLKTNGCYNLQCASINGYLDQCFKEAILYNQCLNAYSIQSAFKLESQEDKDFNIYNYYHYHQTCSQNLYSSSVLKFSQCSQNCALISQNSFQIIQNECINQCGSLNCEYIDINNNFEKDKCNNSLTLYQQCEQKQPECIYYYQSKKNDYFQNYKQCFNLCKQFIEGNARLLNIVECTSNCPNQSKSNSKQISSHIINTFNIQLIFLLLLQLFI